MTWDLTDFRLVTASAYPGLMEPLTTHASCVCVLSGDAADNGGTSLEGLDGVRRRWRFGDVARLADFVPKVLADMPPDNRPILLIPPRSSVAWEAAAAAWPGDARVVGIPADQVGRIAEDKIFVREQMRRMGIPVPDQLIRAGSDVDFTEAARELGLPFVMQAPNSAGGQGTYLIGTEQDLTSLPRNERWLISRYAGEATINVTGLVHFDGVQLLPASVQTSGIAELGVAFGGYCGTDFAAALRLPPAVLAAARNGAALIATWLRDLGYRGMFGVDIAVSGEQVAFLEVNPRVQGSSWLLSKLQQPPLLERHVQALLGAPVALHDRGAIEHPMGYPASPRSWEPDGTPARQASGSSLMVRWQGKAGVVRYVPEVGPGVTAMPRVGTTVLPGAILARVESDASMAAADGRSLLPATTAMLRVLRESLVISPLA